MGELSEGEPRARVGTSGWKKPMWRGHFYPHGLPQRLELEYAATHLTTLEINTTFHGLARPSSYQTWHSETPDGFLYAVKGNKEITHEQRLRNPAQNVAQFLGSGVLGLQEKLGPILWQLPPSFPFDPTTVEAFLAVLPHSLDETRQLLADQGIEFDQAVQDAPDRPIRHALEVRHDSFTSADYPDLLRKYDIAAVVTNTLEWPEIREVTSDFVYVRLHGDLNHYPDGYDEAALDEWATSINGWISGEHCPDGRGRDVFVYFDNPDNEGINSPLDAMRLQQRLDGPGIARPARVASVIQPALWDE